MNQTTARFDIQHKTKIRSFVAQEICSAFLKKLDDFPRVYLCCVPAHGSTSWCFYKRGFSFMKICFSFFSNSNLKYFNTDAIERHDLILIRRIFRWCFCVDFLRFLFIYYFCIICFLKDMEKIIGIQSK